MPLETNEKVSLENRIKVLSRHQDQQKAFFDTLESVRWKFITVFGFGAGFALFFSAIKSSNPKITEDVITLSSILVVIVSLASLLTQIRVYGILHASWKSIGLLQKEEAKLVDELWGLDNQAGKLFVFPHSVAKKQSTHHLLTVHMATCFVFSCFIGLAINILLKTHCCDLYHIDFVLVSSLIIYLSWLITYKFTSKVLETPNENQT